LDLVNQLKLRNELVALFVVDQMMPEMTGVEFLQHAKSVFVIDYEQGMMTYRTTPKGLRLLQLYNNVNEMVQPAIVKSEKNNNDLLFL
jgi:thioredoxin reductase (NADPH)